MNEPYWSGLLAQRLTRRRALASSAGLAASAAFLAACGKSSGGGGGGGNASGIVVEPKDTSKTAKRGGIFKSVHTMDPPSLDPYTSPMALRTSTMWTYSRLMGVKPGFLADSDGEIVGDLAESWEYSPDNLTLTLKLRSDAKFAPTAPVSGRVVDAQDVVYSWKKFASVGAERITFAASANPDAPLQSLNALDNRTIQIKLTSPLAAFLATLANSAPGNFFIIPKEAESSFDIRGTAIGSGAFYITEYVPSARIIYRRNPGFYDKEHPFIDGIDAPIIPEYAADLSQFIAGNIYGYAVQAGFWTVRGDDILSTKRQVPDLQLMQDQWSVTQTQINYGMRPTPPEKTLLRDVRLRQALSMSIDRDLYLDVFYNVEKLKAEGIALQTRWNTALLGRDFDSWYLDPRDKSFGDNRKYLQFDLTEAKKLISAAGFANGVDVDLHFADTLPRENETVRDMIQQAGIRLNLVQHQAQEYANLFSRKKGDHEGIRFGAKPLGGYIDVGEKLFAEYNSKGNLFDGFDPDGRGTFAGDPMLDILTTKLRTEFDQQKRIAVGKEIQQYHAKMQYGTYFPGGARALSLAWPVMQNRNVYRLGLNGPPFMNEWLDQSLPPLKKAT